MVITQLKGGLGNQMFQYAAARAVLGGKGKVLIDLGFFQNHRTYNPLFTPKQYELGIFQHLNSAFLSSRLAKILYGGGRINPLLRKLLFPNMVWVTQHETEFMPALINAQPGSYYLRGYFQSEKYIKEVRRELLREFTFPEVSPSFKGVAAAIQAAPNAVSLHVRRGDYLKPQVLRYHGVLPMAYYQQAIERIQSQVGDATFFVFSDDMAWCRAQLPLKVQNVHFVENPSSEHAWVDMYLMTLCRHHIVANSSFSWWGAWLSQQAEGITLAPRKWFNPEVVPFNIHDFVPTAWDIIDYE